MGGIQHLGLPSQYKQNNSEEGKCLNHIFGLVFLSPEVGDCFVEDSSQRCQTENNIKSSQKKLHRLWGSVLTHALGVSQNFLQVTTNACESFHSHLKKYFYHNHPDNNLFIMKLKECQHMIYAKLHSVTLPATETNKRSHVAKGLVEDLVKKYETGEISSL
jgi:hypothetical protein